MMITMMNRSVRISMKKKKEKFRFFFTSLLIFGLVTREITHSNFRLLRNASHNRWPDLIAPVTRKRTRTKSKENKIMANGSNRICETLDTRHCTCDICYGGLFLYISLLLSLFFTNCLFIVKFYGL